MNVGAVRDGVGVAEALDEAAAARDVQDHFAGDRVHEPDALDQKRFALHTRADAERIEDGQGVGRDLKPDANLPKGRRLLQHRDRKPFLRQPQRAGETANPPARNQRRIVTTSRHSPPPLSASLHQAATAPDVPPNRARHSARVQKLGSVENRVFVALTMASSD